MLSKTIKILDPFFELCNLVPDINEKRAAKGYVNWVFTEDPLDWSQNFPRFILKLDDSLEMRELAAQQIDDENHAYYMSGILNITYYIKTNESYICPDLIERHGVNVLDYMMSNQILPVFNKNKIKTLRKYSFLERMDFLGINKIDERDRQGLGLNFRYGVSFCVLNPKPIANDGYISNIVCSVIIDE